MTDERILFVGGPWHGARMNVPSDRWTVLAPIPRQLTLAMFTSEVLDPSPMEVVSYSRTRWPYRVDLFPPVEHQYVMLGPIGDERPALHPGAQDDDPRYAHIADRMWLARAEAQLPPCVAPGCQEKGRTILIAEEWGRFVGRWWERGEKIRLCMPHYADLVQAQGQYGVMDQLAEWLRPDASNLDPLDGVGVGILFQDELVRTRGRVIRVGMRVKDLGARRG